MNKSEIINMINKASELYSNESSDFEDVSYQYYDENESKNIMQNIPKFSMRGKLDLFIEATEEIEDPVERIDKILSLIEVAELKIGSVDLYRILEILPYNQKAEMFYAKSLGNYMNGSYFNAEFAGKIFKECGQDLDALPEEYLLCGPFLQGWIRGTKSPNPDIVDKAFTTSDATRREIIDDIKTELNREASELGSDEEPDEQAEDTPEEPSNEQ